MKLFDFKKLFLVLLGNTIFCLGVVAFILPLGLITGGTTGLGLIAEHWNWCGNPRWSFDRRRGLPPLIINKKFGISISVGLYVCDFAILIGQMIFRDREKILYGIVLVIIYTFVMDKVLVSGKNQIEAKIISKKYEEINVAIQQKLDRGSTFIKSETGYKHEDTMIVMTVVSNREIARLNQIVLEIDPKAFIVINEAKEVMGRGFTLHKYEH